MTDWIFAVRRLRSGSPGTLGIIALLAIAVGLASTTFALGDPFLTKPLPFYHADRLVLIDVRVPISLARITFPRLSDWQRRTDLFQGLAAFAPRPAFRARVAGRVVAIETVAVSANLFSVLGVTLPMADGRAFDASDDVWLTDAAVRGPLGRSSGLDKQTIPLAPSGALHVLGRLPSNFLFPDPSQVSAVDAVQELPDGPIATTGNTRVDVTRLIGRLDDGVTVKQAAAALAADAAERGFGIAMRPLAPAMKERMSTMAMGGLWASILVLAVCATNIAGIALTRGLHRASELATLETLGATHTRIVRILTIEGFILALSGLVGGWGMASLLIRSIGLVIPGDLLTLGAPEISLRVALFGAIAASAIGLSWATGSVVAWSGAWRPELRQRVSREGRTVRAVRFGVIAGQVGLTSVLLAGASLLGRSYLNLMNQNTGMAGESLAISALYPADLERMNLGGIVDGTLRSLLGTPGVRRAAASIGQMVDDFSVTHLVLVDGHPRPVDLSQVSTDYFATAHMTLASGRFFNSSDNGSQAVIISETLANRYLPPDWSVGHELRVGDRVMTIVGIVKDSLRKALDQPPKPAIFLPLDVPMSARRVTYLVDCAACTTMAGTALEDAVQRLSPDAVVLDATSVRSRLYQSIQDRTFATLLIGLFGIATVCATLAGVAGVVGYAVARRQREIGIRLAIGATPSSVARLIVKDVAVSTAAGATAGFVASIWLSRFLESALFGIGRARWTTLTTSTMLLIAVALLTAALPARKAKRLSPMTALRDQ